MLVHWARFTTVESLKNVLLGRILFGFEKGGADLLHREHVARMQPMTGRPNVVEMNLCTSFEPSDGKFYDLFPLMLREPLRTQLTAVTKAQRTIGGR